MLKDMQAPRVLFYADMEAIIPHCVAAAEMLRRQLGAHIIMMVHDRKYVIDGAFESYELYDHEGVLQLSNKFVSVTPIHSDDRSRSPNVADAIADINRDESPSENHRRNEFFGLRKLLSRSDALKA